MSKQLHKVSEPEYLVQKQMEGGLNQSYNKLLLHMGAAVIILTEKQIKENIKNTENE